VDTIGTKAAARARRVVDGDAGRRVGLVPTMGYLHEGHLSLVRRARQVADTVWVSIFVNPTQFGPAEDLDRYPRGLDRDLALLEAEGVDVVFNPEASEMYPSQAVVQIVFSGLEHVLCGTDRPTHFAGVGLVICKLFNLIRPEVAVFGQKDAQQALLIRSLAADLDFEVEVDIAPTVREMDGLAMSSRNTHLTAAERGAAPAIYRALQAGRDLIARGEPDPTTIVAALRGVLADEPLLRPQYVECVRASDLKVPETIDEPVLLAIAVRTSGTRLIDNFVVDPQFRG